MNVKSHLYTVSFWKILNPLWKGVPILTLWGSSQEKFLGTKDGRVCLPCTLSKEQGRRNHHGTGGPTAMCLWNMKLFRGQ